MWPKPSIDPLGEDIKVLIQFWNALVVDKKHMESFTISNSLDSVLEAPDERGSGTSRTSSLPRGSSIPRSMMTDSLPRHDSAAQVCYALHQEIACLCRQMGW